MKQEIKDKIEERILGLTYSPDLSQKEVFRAGMMEVINHPAEYLQDMSDEDIEKLAEKVYPRQIKSIRGCYEVGFIKGYKAAQHP